MDLTPSEHRVITLVAKGLSNKEIGHKLKLTEKTIKYHLTNIFAKLGVRSRAELIIQRLATDKVDNDFFKLMHELIKGDEK